MGIAAGVGHFFQSIIEVIQGLLGAVVNFFQWILNSIIGLFQGFVHFVEGTLGFAIRKINFTLSYLRPAILTQSRQLLHSGNGGCGCVWILAVQSEARYNASQQNDQEQIDYYVQHRAWTCDFPSLCEKVCKDMSNRPGNRSGETNRKWTSF